MLQLMRELRVIQQSSIDNAVERIMSSLRTELDARSIGGGEVSMNRLVDMLAPIHLQLRTLAE